MRRNRRIGRIFAAALMAVTSVAVTAALPAQASPGTLKLFAVDPDVTIRHREGRPASLNPGVFAAAVGGAFEIHANRAGYGSPIVGSQWADGAWVRDLDSSMVDSWRGLRSFIHVRVKGPDGDVIVDRDLDWCPTGWDNQRVDDSGPDVQRFPMWGCFAMPFSLGTVWGIDQGWASPLTSRYGGSTDPVRLNGRDGTYRVRYSFPQAVIDTFGIDPADAMAKVRVTLETGRGHSSASRRAVPAQQEAAPRVPIDRDPDPSTVPDLIPTPAWSIDITRTRNGPPFLAFASNIWNAGPSPMVVEGFRRSDSNVMDAYQYFYDGATPVGRTRAGTFEFDTRHGHHHWHMDQFVRYDLLNADRTQIVRSTKQSFCLVPTDAIDLTVENADWQTDFGGGLGTACGGSDAIWIREVLPVGWGDTYYQYVAGQSFPIKGLPNGRYYVQVTANPTEEMIEASTANNVSLRRVVLRGKAGERRVIVPPHMGIDH